MLNYLDKVNCLIQNEIAIVTIKNPPANTLNTKVMDALEMCFDELYLNDNVRAVVITGAGKHFVAGADINEFATWSGNNAVKFTQRGQKLFTKIENLPIPVIAAINGYSLGGGLELSLACDIRVASEKAKFGLPETTLGIGPGYGGTARLSFILSEGQAKKLIFTGELITAYEAKNIRLIEEIVEHEMLMKRALELAEMISQNAPIAIRNIKKAINSGRNQSLENKLREELKTQEICFASKDRLEGVSAFISKRKPIFRNE